MAAFWGARKSKRPAVPLRLRPYGPTLRVNGAGGGWAMSLIGSELELDAGVPGAPVGRNARGQVGGAAAERLIGVLPVLRRRGDRGEAELHALLHPPREAGLGEVARRVGRHLADLAGNRARGEPRG